MVSPTIYSRCEEPPGPKFRGGFAGWQFSGESRVGSRCRELRAMQKWLAGVTFAVALVAHTVVPATIKVAVLCIVTCQAYSVTLQVYRNVLNFTVILHP
jgi:hypothetical protein